MRPRSNWGLNCPECGASKPDPRLTCAFCNPPDAYIGRLYVDNRQTFFRCHNDENIGYLGSRKGPWKPIAPIDEDNISYGFRSYLEPKKEETVKPPGQVVYPYPNDCMIWDADFMPSAEFYAIVTYRSDYYRPREKGQKAFVTLVPCDAAQVGALQSAKRLNRWFLIKFMRGKPTLNKRKVYVLTAPTKLLREFKDIDP